MDFPGCVTRLERDGKSIVIVGTAHVSQASVDEVHRTIAEVHPDTVCVELDKHRHDALVNENRYANLDLVRKIKERQVLFLLASLALAAYQKRIGQRLGVKPGAELLAAVKGCTAIGARLVLADRDIQVTLKRTWANISTSNKLRLLVSLLAAPFAAAELSQDQVEQLKDRDTISEMLAELSRMVPGLKEPLIDERDLYLASSIRGAPGNRLVAVMGAGHVEGVIAALDQEIDRNRLERLPTVSSFRQWRRWVVPAIAVLVLYLGWSMPASAGLVHMASAWTLSTGLASALFATAAGAHPFSIAVSFLSAPLVVLYPRVSTGLFPALVQASIRRPTEAHSAAILDSISTLRGWYRNPATRLLLVYVLSALGASLGALIGTVWMVCLL